MAFLDPQPTGFSGGNAHQNFNVISGASEPAAPEKTFDDLSSSIAQIRRDFKDARRHMRAEQLRSLYTQLGGDGAQLQGLRDEVQEELLPHNMQQIDEWIRLLSHPDAPVIGQKFLAARNTAGINRKINSNQISEICYASFRLTANEGSGDPVGFVNEISMNPLKIPVEKLPILFGSDIHETIHGISTSNADSVLKKTPWNKDTRVVLHPLMWILAENISERVAYTGEALGYTLLGKALPEMYEDLRYATEKYVVSVDDMKNALQRTSSLQEALTEATIVALDKRVKRHNNFGPTEADKYYNIALSNFWDGMRVRCGMGDTDFEFVKLEPSDFYKIGDIGFGVNLLGEHGLDPRFLNWPALRIDEQEYLDELCRTFNIPPLSECMTLREYESGQIKQKAPAVTTGASSYSFGKPELVHAPA